MKKKIKKYVFDIIDLIADLKNQYNVSIYLRRVRTEHGQINYWTTEENFAT